MPARPPRSRRTARRPTTTSASALQARLLGDGDTALAELKKAARLDPASSEVRVETAKLLRDTGKLDEALDEAREAVKLDADDAEAHLVLGQLLQASADGPQAPGPARRRRRPSTKRSCACSQPTATP